MVLRPDPPECRLRCNAEAIRRAVSSFLQHPMLDHLVLRHFPAVAFSQQYHQHCALMKSRFNEYE